MSSTSNHQSNPNSPDQLQEYFERLNSGAREPGEIGHLSDLPRPSVRWLSGQWHELSLDSRRYLVEQMLHQSNENIELNFRHVFRIALQDTDPEIRARSIVGLWEDTGTSILENLLNLAEQEPDWVVQEQVARALGRFSYQAGLGELNTEYIARVRLALMAYLGPDVHPLVRSRALESISYFAGDELVDEHLLDAATDSHPDVQAAAILGMGRQLDDRWFTLVRNQLASDEPEVRQAAAHALGDFGAQETIVDLVPLLEDDDEEIQTTAIRSIGAIGGREAIQILEALRNEEETPRNETIDEALQQARFQNEPLEPDA